MYGNRQQRELKAPTVAAILHKQTGEAIMSDCEMADKHESNFPTSCLVLCHLHLQNGRVQTYSDVRETGQKLAYPKQLQGSPVHSWSHSDTRLVTRDVSRRGTRARTKARLRLLRSCMVQRHPWARIHPREDAHSESRAVIFCGATTLLRRQHLRDTAMPCPCF